MNEVDATRENSGPVQEGTATGIEYLDAVRAMITAFYNAEPSINQKPNFKTADDGLVFDFGETKPLVRGWCSRWRHKPREWDITVSTEGSMEAVYRRHCSNLKDFSEASKEAFDAASKELLSEKNQTKIMSGRSF
ncbi:hypothetical protein KIH39_18440 [Telmatocola sphagniphila]|uniref:Uncharacterized protein n=1 Tax=Telmatocola sphagniphila TaxID=1123043 RepID=A0A8E6EU51_9BACT|nr:hypothetical protein [Telmatocola sphagniphila]QVL30817.1 hypothetical protein KIH39_18440 [Telmatocola sphagniphila]